MIYEFADKLLVKEDPGLYSFINQGCLTVDNMDDKEEMRLTDVSQSPRLGPRAPDPHTSPLSRGLLCLHHSWALCAECDESTLCDFAQGPMTDSVP